MASGGPSTAHAGAGGPKPAPPPVQSERVEQKRDLASWWKNFKRGDKKAPDIPGTFGQTWRSASVSLLRIHSMSHDRALSRDRQRMIVAFFLLRRARSALSIE